MAAQSADDTIPLLCAALGSWRISLGRSVRGDDQLARLYDAKARNWSNTQSWLGALAAYRSVWLDLLKDYASDLDAGALRALDCGIGDGAFAAAFATVRRGALDLHGVDTSEEMLKYARNTLSRQGVDATLWSANGNDLPFENGAFDVVFAAHMLEHLPQPELALAELYRVLRPEGLLVVALTRRSPLGRLIQLRWRTHVFDDAQAAALLKCGGFSSIAHLPQPAHRLFNQLSLICCARKPAPRQI